MKKEISEIYDLINNRNIDKAYFEAKKLYQVHQRDVRVIKILAFLNIQRNRFEQTINLLNDFYNRNPEKKDFDYFINMGVSYQHLEEFEKSLEMYERARELNPDSPLGYTVPAEIYLKLRNFKKSNELINIALAKVMSSNEKTLHFPNVVKIKTEINVALNKDQENVDFLLNLLKVDFNSDLFYLLASIQPELINKELLVKAEAYLKGNDKIFKNSLDRFWYVHPLYFGLAMFYQHVDKKKSENFYHLGNNETIKAQRYNSFEYQKNIELIIQNYKSEFLDYETIDDNKKIGENNFFILGTPRSGTTLIESIIASNKNVKSGGELQSASRLLHEYLAKNELPNKDEFTHSFQKTYLKRTNYIKEGSKYIIDKLPENFLFIGHLLKLLPASKIIRTFRNPWDVAISLYKQRYVTNIPYSSSFFNIGVFMANFEAINIYWDECISKKINILDIYYEDLVKNPQINQKNIYEFLDLEIADFDEENRRKFFSKTASIRQIGGQIHDKSVEKQEFLEFKDEFYDSLLMQRRYWSKKGLNPKNSTFFGYELK